MILFTILGTSSCIRIVRQPPATSDLMNTTENLIDEASHQENESFINMSELKNLDMSELLEINFINKSVTHYKDKLHQVRSSLQNRVKNLIANVRSSKSSFSPELGQKLNDSFFQLVQNLQISPYCLASLNHLRMEIAERRLWPFKCECI